MAIDFRNDARAVRVMLGEAFERYGRLHAAPATAAKHPPVTHIDLEVWLAGDESNPAVYLHLDTRPNGQPDGDQTYQMFAKTEFPQWLADLDAHVNGNTFRVTQLDGSTVTVTSAKFEQVFHQFFVDMLKSARDDGLLKALPIAPDCELGVQNNESGFGWPHYDDQGLENMADPRENGRRRSPDLPLSEAERIKHDVNAYDVWAKFDTASKARAIAAVAKALDISLPAAKQTLESGAPVAGDVQAAEVQRLARIFREAGVGIEVKPPFPWRLQ